MIRPKEQQNVLQLRCEPLERVRIGFIGLGVRAKRAIERMMHIEGAVVTAICDLVELNIEEAQSIITSSGKEPAATYCDSEGWMRVCESPDIDLVYICTDWLSHAKIAVHAMNCGKHVALEVPAAMTIDECWSLVDTAEKHRRHCIMLENCCYDEFELTLLNMAQLGVLGEIIHAEGSYLHDLRERIASNDQGGRRWTNWQTDFLKGHNGNPYPTHGLGPIALAMGIHRGDRMNSIVSVSSKRVSCGDDCNALSGNMNTSIITTEKGHTIVVQHCVSLPHPYSRSFLLSGTKGFAQKYPQPHIAIDPDGERAITGEELNNILGEYCHPFVKTYKDFGERLCGRRWIDYAMDSRLIYCLRNGLPLDMDVYDAAEWSCLVELTERSSQQGGAPIEFPDFTRGDWNRINGVSFAE
ncbi:MAG: Gfo/Idh/MocA family oxidoreductase [Bacteroidaceae bacterium]|nr:Gfo/Idh/MocA family oxidoreductase [Bacteroidaceae bacterium]